MKKIILSILLLQSNYNMELDKIENNTFKIYSIYNENFKYEAQFNNHQTITFDISLISKNIKNIDCFKDIIKTMLKGNRGSEKKDALTQFINKIKNTKITLPISIVIDTKEKNLFYSLRNKLQNSDYPIFCELNLKEHIIITDESTEAEEDTLFLIKCLAMNIIKIEYARIIKTQKEKINQIKFDDLSIILQKKLLNNIKYSLKLNKNYTENRSQLLFKEQEYELKEIKDFRKILFKKIIKIELDDLDDIDNYHFRENNIEYKTDERTINMLENKIVYFLKSNDCTFPNKITKLILSFLVGENNKKILLLLQSEEQQNAITDKIESLEYDNENNIDYSINYLVNIKSIYKKEKIELLDIENKIKELNNDKKENQNKIESIKKVQAQIKNINIHNYNAYNDDRIKNLEKKLDNLL